MGINIGNVFKKVVRLLKQKSTWAGAGVIAAVAGNAALGNKLGDIGTADGLIFGTGLMATDTSAPTE